MTPARPPQPGGVDAAEDRLNKRIDDVKTDILRELGDKIDGVQALLKAWAEDSVRKDLFAVEMARLDKKDAELEKDLDELFTRTREQAARSASLLKGLVGTAFGAVVTLIVALVAR